MVDSKFSGFPARSNYDAIQTLNSVYLQVLIILLDEVVPHNFTHGFYASSIKIARQPGVRGLVGNPATAIVIRSSSVAPIAL